MFDSKSDIYYLIDHPVKTFIRKKVLNMSDSFVTDPRITSALEAWHVPDTITFPNGYAVAPLTPYPAATHPGHTDAYHMGTNLTPDSVNVKVPVDRQVYALYDNLFDPVQPNSKRERYVIICDNATGARIKVILPTLPNR